MTIIEAMTHPQIFGPFFKDESWSAWRVFLRALYALPMSPAELEVYRKHTGRQCPPTKQARECYVIAGRRAGKSRIAALVSVYLSCFRDYSKHLAPGERGTMMNIAQDRRQARIETRYMKAFLEVPMLAGMVLRQTQETVDLSNSVTIETHVTSFRSTRGYPIIGFVGDEIGYWRDESSANPDSEILNALRPGAASIPDSLLLAISSPYARRGVLWQMFQRYYGKDGDDHVLVWNAATRDMNPLIDQAIIDRALAEDEPVARAEWFGEFRRDIESYLSVEIVQAAVGQYSRRGYDSRWSYDSFGDSAGGSGQDSFAAAVSHREGDRAVVDAVAEIRPPFDPEKATAAICDELLKPYKVARIEGDRYAGSWPAEQFAKKGVRYMASGNPKSLIYAEALPLFNAGRVEIPNNPRLINQLIGLERRTGRGRDIIDSAPNGHDDLANVACGAALVALGKGTMPRTRVVPTVEGGAGDEDAFAEII
jgi:hypothetical protein